MILYYFLKCYLQFHSYNLFMYKIFPNKSLKIYFNLQILLFRIHYSYPSINNYNKNKIFIAIFVLFLRNTNKNKNICPKVFSKRSYLWKRWDIYRFLQSINYELLEKFKKLWFVSFEIRDFVKTVSVKWYFKADSLKLVNVTIHNFVSLIENEYFCLWRKRVF